MNAECSATDLHCDECTANKCVVEKGGEVILQRNGTNLEVNFGPSRVVWSGLTIPISCPPWDKSGLSTRLGMEQMPQLSLEVCLLCFSVATASQMLTYSL